ncbi:MAG: protein jag [Ruminococcus sp.]|jgi:spoIIIJ-associated protein|nr:protein jag [Ruminococcus sp.]
MKQEFTAKTIEDAKEAASAAFEVPVSEIVFTVIDEPKKGLLGIGSKDAKILAEYTPKTKGQIALAYVKTILTLMGIDNELELREEKENAFIDVIGEVSGTVIGRRGETLDAIQYLASMSANRGTRDYFRVTLNCNGYREKREEILKSLATRLSQTVIKSGGQTTLEPMNPYERRIIHATVSEISGVTSKSIGDEPFRRVVISSTGAPKRRFQNDKYDGPYPRVSGPKTFSRPPKNLSDVPVSPRPDRSDRSDRNDRSDRDRSDYNRSDRDRSDYNRPYNRPKSDDIQLKQIEMPKSSFERDYKKPKTDDSVLGAGSLYDRLDI